MPDDRANVNAAAIVVSIMCVVCTALIIGAGSSIASSVKENTNRFLEHEKQAGHGRMQERFESLTRRVDTLEGAVRNINDTVIPALRRIEKNIGALTKERQGD